MKDLKSNQAKVSMESTKEISQDKSVKNKAERDRYNILSISHVFIVYHMSKHTLQYALKMTKVKSFNLVAQYQMSKLNTFLLHDISHFP